MESKMSCRDRVLAVMAHESTDRPAAAIFTTCDTTGMQKACGCMWPEAHSDAKKMATLGCAQTKFGLEACRAGFDLTEEAEVLGCEVDIGAPNRGPAVKTPAYPKDISESAVEVADDMPEIDTFLKSGRIKTVIEAMGIMKKTHGEDYAIIGGSTGPVTTTGHVLGVENLLMGTFLNPDGAKAWIAVVNKYIRALGEALLANGADIVQMSEPTGSTDMLDPELFPDFSGQFVKHSLGDLPGYTVLHICGYTQAIIPKMQDTGVDGISIEEKVDSYEAIKIGAGRCAMIGNVGCAFPLFQGTPKDVHDAATKSYDAGFNSISAGCGVPIGTPDDNIRALVDAVVNHA